MISSKTYRVAVASWYEEGDGIAEAIAGTLAELGHQPVCFHINTPIPKSVDVVFVYAPYGPFLHIARQLAAWPGPKKPRFVFWHTEGLPDLRIPWRAMQAAGRLRSRHARFLEKYPTLKKVPPFSFLRHKMQRYRHLGDIQYAYQSGLIDVLADISQIYTNLFQRNGISAVYAPFGAYEGWYADMGLTRDVDVLWMGTSATKRRSRILSHVREGLGRHGVEMLVVDGRENPFVYGDERTQLLNRTKITLNLLRTWYDENSLRFCLAIPNRSLVVSEPLLAHVPFYQAGDYYISAPHGGLVETILYYLRHEEERRDIVDNAYRAMTTDLTFRHAIGTIMAALPEKAT